MIKNLKLLRNRRCISQQALAAAVGVSQQSINKYENHNIEPDTKTLMKLADFFETSVDYLIGHTDIDHTIEAVSPYDLNQDEIELIDNHSPQLKLKRAPPPTPSPEGRGLYMGASPPSPCVGLAPHTP